MSNETMREAVRALKRRFANWRTPAVELPAESVIEDAVCDVVRIANARALALVEGLLRGDEYPTAAADLEELARVLDPARGGKGGDR